MEYDFDRIIPREGTRSEKYSRKTLEEKFGNPDAIPMWVADMDFQCAPPIVEAVTRRAAHGIYGYTSRDDEYFEAIAGWQRRRHGWDIQKDWICYTAGVVPAVCYVLLACTRPGDKVLIQEPVYHPFRNTAEGLDRGVEVNPLVLRDGRWQMDFEDLEKKAADPGVKVLILCSPHNPVGRVWTREELLRVGEICLRHGLLILSDEIHNDLIMPGHRHTVFAGLSPELAARTVTCTSPSKTFNLAGMQSSSIIIPDADLRGRYHAVLQKLHLGGQNPFGMAATVAAYNQCGDWVDQAVGYIHQNFLTLRDGLQKTMPKAVVYPLEGTYLAWADLSAYLEDGPEPAEVQVGRRAGVALDGGTWFGQGGRGCLRFNLACPRSLVVRAVGQIAAALG